MSDIKTVIFVRGKKTSAEMRELAAENEMILIETPYSMYRTSGLLFQAGVLSLY
jgi:serine kinase of HPr protein (carbohydrate metabolism regulator)